jgi:glycosyltransferase involved in cell wall biosynthesis
MIKLSAPLISVIIPVFNVEKYLERCLNSVIHQNYNKIEILAINDGSTDSSLNILKNFQKKYNNQLIIINKENGGQASARNLGIEYAHGEYLMMLDADDFLAEDTIDYCIKSIQSKRCDLIIFDYFQINEKGKSRCIKTGTTLDNAGTFPWNKLYKRSLWNDCRFPEGYWYEDLGIIPVIVAKSKNIVKIDKPLYYYETSRKDSQTNLIDKSKIFDIIPMIENVYNELQRRNIIKLNYDELNNLFIEHLIYVTLLLKIPYIKDIQVRKKLINSINNSMEKHIPNWKKNKYINGNILSMCIKKITIYCYLKNQFFIGNILWKYPKKIKKILWGF